MGYRTTKSLTWGLRSCSSPEEAKLVLTISFGDDDESSKLGLTPTLGSCRQLLSVDKVSTQHTIGGVFRYIDWDLEWLHTHTII